MKPYCVNCFKAIAVTTRFKIFTYLKDKQSASTISSLVKLTSLRQPTVTFHVNELVRMGFVKKFKLGREVWCNLRKKCDNCPLFAD